MKGSEKISFAPRAGGVEVSTSQAVCPPGYNPRMHGLVVLVYALLFSAPSLDDVNRAVRDVLADSGIQTEYPGEEAAPSPEPPQRDPARSSSAPYAPGRSAFLSTVLWVLVGVVGVLLLVWLLREVKGYSRPVEVDEATAIAVPSALPVEAELGDAEVLAGEGRYEEAVHLLLLRALRSIERAGSHVSSNTSREVIRAAAIAGESRDAVMGLVGAVELSLFGGRPVDESGYRTSVDHYRRFLAARA